MSEIRKWELKIHNHQIADTGDYDGHYELTDGMTSLITKDDIDEDQQAMICNALNDLAVNWEDWNANNLEFELQLEKENCKKWKEIASNGRMVIIDVLNGNYGMKDEHLKSVYDHLQECENAIKNLP